MTERLTDKTPCRTCQRSCFLDYECEERANYEYECMKKLSEYENAEEEGKLVVLPCKIGTPVYEVLYTLNYGEIGDKAKRQYFIVQQSFCYGDIHKLGKTIFLTRKEAQKALEEMEK